MDNKENQEIQEQIIQENDKADKINSFRMWQLAAAECLDAWRIVPRVVIVLYGIMVTYLMNWYLDIATFPKIQCSADVLTALLNKGIALDKAQAIACQTVEIIGGATTGQTAFVTAVIGLSSAIFGFYVSTGKDWSKSILPWKFGAAKTDLLPPPKPAKTDDSSTK